MTLFALSNLWMVRGKLVWGLNRPAFPRHFLPTSEQPAPKCVNDGLQFWRIPDQIHVLHNSPFFWINLLSEMGLDFDVNF